ncbi:MAG: 4Fe-4S dicluster domain-containing protein [Anaerolineales bacterium]|nr:4Fe-4S dicluster domain-containing protein [Anaerolineales bacterium]
MAFRDDIQAISGQNVNICFQCSKCSAGCPLADKMDLKPAQVMHSIRLGRADSVLNSRAIWLCLGCETCSARCPQQVEPAAAMEAARLLALQKGIKPSVREIGIYYRGFVDNMRLNGKIHDTSVAGITQLLTGQLIASLPLAWKLFVRGRVKLPPLPLGGGGYRRMYNRALAREREAR